MKKLSFVLSILKQRISTIILLSIMFSALLLIFMVGFSLKDVFYEYLRSGYGNVPDLQAKVHNIETKKLLDFRAKVKNIDEYIDILFGYEDTYPITVTDSEDSVLAKEMPVLIKGLNLQNKLLVELDGKQQLLVIDSFEYDDNLHIELDLGDIKVKDKDSVEFIARGKAVELNFCTMTSIEDNKLILESQYCQDEIDQLFSRIDEKKSKYLKVGFDAQVSKLKILDIDRLYRTLVLKYDKKLTAKEFMVKLENIEIPNDLIESLEVYDGELIITFKRVENLELEYKRSIALILQNYINYNRFVLRVKNYAFDDEDEDALQRSQSVELVWLNELTDFLDMITHTNGNLAVSSSYLAYDLNNLGILDNFTIASGDAEFVASIRSTFSYNPEKIYDKNILIFNKKVLEEQFGVGDENNFIDLYIDDAQSEKLDALKQMILKLDPDAKFITQEDIIPSIGPKKHLFNIVVISFTLLIFGILFVAMYVVLRQFYSNFESELALLKLFGLNQPFQAYINTTSFFISAVLIYFVLKYEESLINEIMMKYFFTRYDFDMINYLISLLILALYIFIIYLLERSSMKQLNLIKGQ